MVGSFRDIICASPDSMHGGSKRLGHGRLSSEQKYKFSDLEGSGRRLAADRPITAAIKFRLASG